MSVSAVVVLALGLNRSLIRQQSTVHNKKETNYKEERTTKLFHKIIREKVELEEDTLNVQCSMFNVSPQTIDNIDYVTVVYTLVLLRVRTTNIYAGRVMSSMAWEQGPS